MFAANLSTDPRGSIFIDPNAYTDPEKWHAVAAELRAEVPVLRVEADGFLPFYALTRHADVFEVSRRSDVWINTQKSVLMPEWAWDLLKSSGVEPKTLIHVDGDEHRDLRLMTNDWFKPAAVRHLQGAVDAVAEEFVQKMVDFGGECDFARDIAVPYTLRVIMSIFGVAPEDEPLMLKLTQGILGAADPEFMGDALDPTQIGGAAIAEFGDFFAKLTKDRQEHPTNDLATVIANGEINGCPIDEHARLWYYIIVSTAGHDTTSYAVAGGLEALLRHPEQLAKLFADPSLAANAAEESIRWTSPVRHFLRYAQEDTQVGGVEMKAGERVLMSYWSANRDERVFANPMQFDIERKDVNELISFGLGVHYCLGSQVARREVRTFYSKMLERIEHIEPAGTPEWIAANFVGGVKHLPIRYRVKR